MMKKIYDSGEKSGGQAIKPHSTAFRVGIVYLIFGVLWILFSDMALNYLVRDPEIAAFIQTLKGWFYVFITAGLVYLLVLHDTVRIEKFSRVIRDNEKRFRLLFEESSEAIFIHDIDGRIIDSNRKASELVGPSRTDVRKIIYDLLVNPDDQSINGYVEEVLSSGASRFETRLEDEGGNEIHVDVSSSLIDRDDGLIQSIVRNISEKKHLEDVYIQTQKMETVGRLAGGIAHDFNNLLTVMIGNADLALASISPDDDIYADLTDIRTSAKRAAELTQQLLAFSRKQIIEPKDVNFNSIIESLEPLLNRLGGEKIDMRINCSENLHSVHVDPGQIEQVLTNLVANACDAMPDGGILTIETYNRIIDEDYVKENPGADPGDYAVISVSDNGVGMDSKLIGSIFEPFFSTKGFGRGTGLGLSTCYGIVKQNKGNITVESEPGFGSTFEIFIPALTS